MARVGLLIQVDCLDCIPPHPELQKDLETLKQALQHPRQGGFAEVRTLHNPDPLVLQEAVESLASRSQGDLLLLYFWGQAIQDERGNLYLTTCLTRTNTQGKLVKSTAVPVSFVDDVLRDSHSRQQVIILDCSRSGQVSPVDIKQQLGGEEQVLLTAFTSAQDFFKKNRASFSAYTHYLVEGIATGAADLDQDGVISIHELHEYTCRKVQQAAPAVRLDSQVSGSRDAIVLARVPDDPMLKQRQQVLELVDVDTLTIEPQAVRSLEPLKALNQSVKPRQQKTSSRNGLTLARFKNQPSAAKAIPSAETFTGPKESNRPTVWVQRSCLLLGAITLVIATVYGMRRWQAPLRTNENVRDQNNAQQCLTPTQKTSQSPGDYSDTQKLPKQCEAVNWQNVRVQTLSGHTDPVWSVAISPDGQTLASGSGDQTIKLWRLPAGELLQTLSGHTDTVWSVAISPDGHTLASGSGDQTIKLWSLDGELLRTLSSHTGPIHSVAISPDGQTLASGSGDQTIKLWNLQTGELLSTFSGHTGPIRSVAISPDGQTLASGSGDQTIKLWNLQTGELLSTFSGHTGRVISVAISLDGQILVSGSVDRTAKIWDLRTGKLLHTLSGDQNWVNSVMMGPRLASGYPETLATGSGELKLWNLRSGRLLSTLSQHSGDLTSISFNRDGKTLVSGSQDKTIKVWRR